MSPTDIHVPSHVEVLCPWVDAGVLGPAEVHLAGWAARAAGTAEPLVALGVAFAAWAARHGHTCADLPVLAEVVVAEHALADGPDDAPELPWPDPTAWAAALRATPAVVREVSGCDPEPVLDGCPLVLHGTRLYLQRYWMDECGAVASLRALAQPAEAGEPAAAVPTDVLDALLPPSADGEPNLQREAALAVARHRVSLLVGGPGTGKTYSVARLLAAMLVEQPELRIGLAAPTGKAAARLQESIAASLSDPVVTEFVPEAARTALAAVRPTTVHRLLGSLGLNRQRFRHGPELPLPHDVVVVDETSMVSLPLLARLLEAVRPDARLVLIGDPDQLESVDLGAVLRDLVDVAVDHPSGPLAGHGTRLLRGHRFGGGTPIALLAEAIRRGEAQDGLALLRAPSAPASDPSPAATVPPTAPPPVTAEVGQLSLFGTEAAAEPAAPVAPEATPARVSSPVSSSVRSLTFLETTDPLAPAVVSQVRAIVEPVVQRMRAAAEAGDADTALAAVSELRVLCAHRRGPFGVSDWNRLVESWAFGPGGAGASWFAGRPLLATMNDPRLGMANGDTGVVIRSEGRLVAVFDTGLGRRPFDPVQLEGVDTAYAMTIHKSQGSEYGTVVMVLPPEGSPLVGRELVYTGATRARSALWVVGSAAAFSACVTTPARRMTGLADGLR